MVKALLVMDVGEKSMGWSGNPFVRKHGRMKKKNTRGFLQLELGKGSKKESNCMEI